MTDTTRIRNDAVAWFVRLRDENASEAQWLAFLDWIEAHPEHRRAYDAVERTWVETEGAPGENVRPLPRRPANDDAATGGSRRRWLWGGAAVAASAVFALAVWPQIAPPSVDAYAADEQARTVTLSDGSKVWLNRGARLEARMGRRDREIRLEQGEAAFDVAHQTSRPFVVHAGDRDVRVLGTAFNVIHQGERFVVQVERGVVAVTPAGRSQPTRLTVGQGLRQSGQGPVFVTAEDTTSMSARRDGVLVYREAPFGEVADDLSLYLGKPVIAEGAARDLRFSGVLKADDEATVLGQIEAFAPVRIVRNPTGVRIAAL